MVEGEVRLTGIASAQHQARQLTAMRETMALLTPTIQLRWPSCLLLIVVDAVIQAGFLSKIHSS